MTSDHSHNVVTSLIKIFSMQFTRQNSDPLCQIQWTNHFFLKNQINTMHCRKSVNFIVYIEGIWAKVNLFEKYRRKPVINKEFLFVCLCVKLVSKRIQFIYCTQRNVTQYPTVKHRLAESLYHFISTSVQWTHLWHCVICEFYQNYIKSFFGSRFLLVNVGKGE